MWRSMSEIELATAYLRADASSLKVVITSNTRAAGFPPTSTMIDGRAAGDPAGHTLRSAIVGLAFALFSGVCFLKIGYIILRMIGHCSFTATGVVANTLFSNSPSR